MGDKLIWHFLGEGVHIKIHRSQILEEEGNTCIDSSRALFKHRSVHLIPITNPNIKKNPKSIKNKKEMGIIRRGFSFILGTMTGIYLAQNYNVPNIKKLANTGLLIAKHLEQQYRKPKKKDDDWFTGALFCDSGGVSGSKSNVLRWDLCWIVVFFHSFVHMGSVSWMAKSFDL